MESPKIYIVGIDNKKIIDVCNYIVDIDDSIHIGQTFTTDTDYSEVNENDGFMYYVSNSQLDLDFKNNSLLYVTTDNMTRVSVGMAIDEFYNAQIIPLSIRSFNTIKEDKYDNSIVVWTDISMKYGGDYSKIEYKINLLETKVFEEIISNHYKGKCMYFGPKDQIEIIGKTIYNWMIGTEEEKNKIICENF